MVTDPDESKMTRKFLFCFPLRLGNIIFGYIVILISIAVVAYNLYEFGMNILPKSEYKIDEKFDNWENLGYIFLGENKNDLIAIITLLYYLFYIVIGFLLFVFGAMFTCGAYKANHCMVTTFFVYSFFHLFFTIGLIVWEATTKSWIQLSIIIISDLLLIICLFSVKYLMEAIRTGNIYSRPGEVYYKY